MRQRSTLAHTTPGKHVTELYASNEQDPKYIPPSEPHALCLTVFLSPYNFLPIEHNGEVIVSGVSIHVFFNGQLCDSAYVPKKYASVKYAMAEQIVRFCGQRISRVLEKPWIIVPPGQNPDGSRRNSYGVGRQMSASAEQRWGAMSNAILAEADKAGVNPQGDRSVLGQYLESVSELPMPSEVEDMQKVGSVNFGVIDVVIIGGPGEKKATAPFLAEPTPVKVEGFEPVQPVNLPVLPPSLPFQPPSLPVQTPSIPVQASTDDVTAPLNDVTTRLPGPDAPSETLSDALANAEAPNESGKDASELPKDAATYPTPPSRLPTPPKTDTPSAATKVEPFAHESSHAGLNSPKKRSRSPSSSAPWRPLKRPNLPGKNDSKAMTTEEQALQAIQDKAAQEAEDLINGRQPMYASAPRARRAPSSYGEESPERSSPLSSVPPTEAEERIQTPNQSKVAILKLAPPSTLETGPPKNPKSTRTTLTEFDRLTGGLSASRQRRRNNPQIVVERLDAGFTVPELSRDCVVTYAERGVLRNVASVKEASMEKEGPVIMGVRFIVG